MLVQRATSGGLVERAVREAVDTLAVPKVRDVVLELALRWARLDEVPERGPEVGSFIAGALFHALEQVLGDAAAESVVAQLEPMAAMLADEEISSVRPSGPALEEPANEHGEDDDEFPEIRVAVTPDLVAPQVGGRALFATDPAPAMLPTILVASVDPGGVQELGLALAGSATVEPVGDALAILEHLDRDDTSLVVVDCRRPAVSVETLITLAPELPSDARILLWGERHDLEQHMEGLGIPIPQSWVCCGPDASAEDIAAIVRILMD